MKRHVLFLTSWNPKPGFPTLGIFVRRHAEAAAIANQVSFFETEYSFSNDQIEIETYVSNGVEYYKLVLPWKKAALRPYYYVKGYLKAFKMLRESKGLPDLIHTNVIFPIGLFARFLKARYKIPYVITEHWTGYISTNGSYHNVWRPTFTKLVTNKASALLPVNSELMHAMQGLGLDGNYHIVQNVVSENFFIPIEAKQKSPIRILHVSAMDGYQKNIKGIVRAFARASTKRDDLILVMVGNNPSRDEFIQLSKELKIDQKIEWKGILKGDDLVMEYAKAHVFLLFSLFENYPCVVSEAWATGIKVISTPVGALESITDQKLIEHVGVSDEKALEIALVNLNTDLSEEQRKYIQEFALNEFSVNKIGKQLDAIYESVIQNHVS